MRLGGSVHAELLHKPENETVQRQFPSALCFRVCDQAGSNREYLLHPASIVVKAEPYKIEFKSSTASADKVVASGVTINNVAQFLPSDLHSAVLSTDSAKPDGVWAGSQRLIPTGEQSGLSMRTGATEGASLSIPTRYSPRLLNLNVRC